MRIWTHHRLPDRFVRRMIMTIVLLIGISTGIGLAPPPALGQFVLPGNPALASSAPPTQVERFGGIETAPVRSPLFAEELFRVVAPTVYNRDGQYQDGNVPVELRAELIGANLRRAMSLLKDLETVIVSQAILNGNIVLQVADQQISRPINLLTVTELDAMFNAQTEEEVAEEWRLILQDDFVEILTARAKSGEQILQASRILIGIALIGGLLQLLHWLLRRHHRTLKKQVAEQTVALQQTEDATTTATLSIDTDPDPTVGSGPAVATHPELPRSDPSPLEATFTPKTSAEDSLPEVRSRFTELFSRQLSLKRQLRINRFLRWLVFWSEIAILYGGAIWITSSVTLWHRAKLWLLGLPVDILLAAFGTSLAIRISHWLIHQLAENSQDYDLLAIGESKRRRILRITTISGVLEGIATTFFVTIGIIFIMESLGVPIQSILAGGAVVAFAISFGSQSLVKDIITGCFILLEDQYAVGDVVGISDVSGLVETLNLRVTQLRDAEGQLITIPNSSITQVKNLTRLWSRVDFTVIVAYDTDPKKLLALLQAIGAEMHAEPEWADKIVEAPTVMGIDHLSHEGMLVRVWIKTKPLQQWATGREFRYRVRQAFAHHGIEIGKPQWIFTQANEGKMERSPSSQSLQG